MTKIFIIRLSSCISYSPPCEKLRKCATEAACAAMKTFQQEFGLNFILQKEENYLNARTLFPFKEKMPEGRKGFTVIIRSHLSPNYF